MEGMAKLSPFSIFNSPFSILPGPLDYSNKRDTIGAFVSIQIGVRSLPWRRTKRTHVVCER